MTDTIDQEIWGIIASFVNGLDLECNILFAVTTTASGKLLVRCDSDTGNEVMNMMTYEKWWLWWVTRMRGCGDRELMARTVAKLYINVEIIVNFEAMTWWVWWVCAVAVEGTR